MKDEDDCDCSPGSACAAHSMTDAQALAALDEWQDSMQKEIKDIAKQFDISDSCASNVWYLRTRSRWTQAAENELIRMDKAGEGQPNINEWP